MPLAHILMPQLARRAEEIAAAVGRPTPTGAGYIQASQRRNVEAPVTASNAPAPAPPVGMSYLGGGNIADPASPPTASTKALEQLRADEKKRTVVGTVKNKAIQTAKQADKNDKNTKFPVVPVAPPVEPKPQKTKRGQVMIPMGPGAVAVNERGESLDARGKNLGYLQQGPMHDGVLRQSDLAKVLIAKDHDGNFEPGMALRTGNPDAVKMLYKQFGKHLEEVRANVDAQGMPTDKFPAGYFKGMTKEQREAIEAGVQILREHERGVNI